MKTFKGLNMFYLVRSMVQLCGDRDLAWDPRKDILFLCQHYGTDIEANRARLDKNAIQQNFLGTALFSRQSREDQQNCYQVLLGEALPPTMLLTPPASQHGHGRSQSASELSRPDITSTQSAPLLSNQLAIAPRSPPLPGQKKPSQQTFEEDILKTEGVSASPQAPPESHVSNGGSSSKYRPINSMHRRSKSSERIQSATGFGTSQKNTQSQSVKAALLTFNLQSSKVKSIESSKLSAVSVSSHPAQQYLQSHIGLKFRHSSAPSVPTVNNTITPQSGKVQRDLRQARIEQPGPQVPEAQHATLHSGSSDGDATPALLKVHELEQPPSRLHLVDPDGLYPVHTNPEPIELSTYTPELEAPVGTPKVVAKLSHNIDTASTAKHDLDARPQSFSPETAYMDEIFQALNVSSTRPDVSTSHKSQQHTSDRPSMPHRKSAPLAALPASLMVGGATLHNSDRAYSSSHVVRTRGDHIPVARTNASRYSQVFAPSASAPQDDITVTPAPLSVYKAYQPSVLPLSPPVTRTLDQQGLSTSSEALNDVDGAQDYFKSHKRNASCESQRSHTSQDSGKLAQEYQAELPSFEQAYGAKAHELEAQGLHKRMDSLDVV